MFDPTGKKDAEAQIYQKIEARYKDEPRILMKYYLELKAESKSARTIENYLRDVMLFMGCVDCQDRNKFYLDVDRDVVNEFLIDMSERGLSDSRKSAVWYALQSFFNFLLDRELISKAPLALKGKPKNRDNPQGKAMTEEEVAAVMNYIKENGNPYNVKRDLCWFALGCTTGLRISAILNINIEDIDFRNKQIWVVEKRDKMFAMDICDGVCEIITEYMREIKSRGWYGKAKTHALFLSPNYNRLSYETVRAKIKEYGQQAIKKDISPHAMRRTCATILYNKVKDIYEVSLQMRHGSVKTTQRYIKVSSEQMKRTANILGEMIKQ